MSSIITKTLFISPLNQTPKFHNSTPQSSMPPKLIHRSSHAQSLASDAPFTPAPTRRRRSAIGPSTASTPIDEPPLPQQTPQKPPLKLEPHYTLPPTIPSPFTGTLEASLDAILTWSQRTCPAVKSTQRLVSTLLEAVYPDTHWPSLLEEIYTTPEIEPLHARDFITELLFLVTRTLLPEQIAENRAALARLYETRKHTAIRFVLRYDMLREWKMQPGCHRRDQPVVLESVVPEEADNEAGDGDDGDDFALSWVSAAYAERYPGRKPLMVNVIPTLIAGPSGGFSTFAVRERMKHHVTDLDEYLMLRDEEVEEWSTSTLNMKTCFALLHWQWLRQNNETLGDMEIHGWEVLDVKADECEWTADDPRKKGTGISTKQKIKKEE